MVLGLAEQGRVGRERERESEPAARLQVSFLSERVVCERTPGPSCPQTHAGGLSTWSGWSCNQ